MNVIAAEHLRFPLRERDKALVPPAPKGAVLLDSARKTEQFLVPPTRDQPRKHVGFGIDAELALPFRVHASVPSFGCLVRRNHLGVIDEYAGVRTQPHNYSRIIDHFERDI